MIPRKWNATKLIVSENGEITGSVSHKELSEGHSLCQRFIEQQFYENVQGD